MKFVVVSAVSFYAGYRFHKFCVRLGRAVDILAKEGLDIRQMIPSQDEVIVVTPC